MSILFHKILLNKIIQKNMVFWNLTSSSGIYIKFYIKKRGKNIFYPTIPYKMLFRSS